MYKTIQKRSIHKTENENTKQESNHKKNINPLNAELNPTTICWH